MFGSKIPVQDLLEVLYANANQMVLSIKNTTREELLAESDISLLKIPPVNDDFLYGQIQGIEFVMDLLTDLVSEKTISNDEKVLIESLEENIKEACIVLRNRNPGRTLGHVS